MWKPPIDHLTIQVPTITTTAGNGRRPKSDQPDSRKILIRDIKWKTSYISEEHSQLGQEVELLLESCVKFHNKNLGLSICQRTRGVIEDAYETLKGIAAGDPQARVPYLPNIGTPHVEELKRFRENLKSLISKLSILNSLLTRKKAGDAALSVREAGKEVFDSLQLQRSKSQGMWQGAPSPLESRKMKEKPDNVLSSNSGRGMQIAATLMVVLGIPTMLSSCGFIAFRLATKEPYDLVFGASAACFLAGAVIVLLGCAALYSFRSEPNPEKLCQSSKEEVAAVLQRSKYVGNCDL